MEELFILSVAELNSYIKELLDSDELLSGVWVRGEVSNLTKHPSGHVYFTLKDAESQIRCVMWRNAAERVHFPLEQGVRVVVYGRVSVYEKGGVYQLYAEHLEPDGRGALFEALELLKKRLEAEGLFDQSRKRALPPLPSRVALVTSPVGAAVHDMVRILRQRHPGLEIIIVPTLVQGDQAPESICRALDAAAKLPGVDVVILARGGGSMEDLWAFNDERVARAIYRSPVPVVSAVGHETDFTIADFVADVRAPTPSAAAAIVAPDASELRMRVLELYSSVVERTLSIIEERRRYVQLLTERPVFQRPQNLLEGKAELVQGLFARAVRAAEAVLRNREEQHAALVAALNALSPLAVLARGYALLRRADDGATISSVSSIDVGDRGNLLLRDGLLVCQVLDKEEKEWSKTLPS
jgi:exodeoxyribonuclease VII large subunit